MKPLFRMKIVFKDPTFSALLLRTIANTYYKAADIGECLSTAYQVREGDFESWYEEWIKTAKRVHSYAEDSANKGHTTSAREAYLRASNYYRTSAFFLVDSEDQRLSSTIDLSKECFRNASSLFPFIVESIEIPYEGILLPGYFYHVSKNQDNHDKRQFATTSNSASQLENKQDNDNYDQSNTSSSVYPTLVVHGGFDSTLEELYSFAAAPALERGYNCLTFEGPGQGNVIIRQKLPFRHDWEKVVTPVLDFALSRKDEYNIDPKRIALMGISLGSLLAARASAFEHRFSAVILYDGVYDGYDGITAGFPAQMLEALGKGDIEFVNKTMIELMESDPSIKFNIKHGMWTTGSNSPYELITGAKKYSVKETLTNITCSTLVLEGEKDDSFPGQPKKVYDGLVSIPSSSKKYILFTEEEGGEEHCQTGATGLVNQRIFDWLDETFQMPSKKSKFVDL
jgi:alpha-beta hydrolase superfamily lysophospholipase